MGHGFTFSDVVKNIKVIQLINIFIKKIKTLISCGQNCYSQALNKHYSISKLLLVPHK